MSDESDDALVERVRSGDTDALGQYIEANRSRLLIALERKVGSGLRRKLDLEDILQEVTARALRDLSEVHFADDQDPYGWLLRVMDRQIVDLHRFHFEAQKRAASREVSVDQPAQNASGDNGFADLLIASMTSPSAAVSRDMRLVRVYQAVNDLPTDMRNAIRWRYLEGMSSQQIAAKLDKSDVATRVLLSRAVRKLQAALAEN